MLIGTPPDYPVLRAVPRLRSCDGRHQPMADINGDGSIDKLDAAALIELLLSN
ncbi:MAG: hypothetical protein JXQ75_17220 [Phycisphaerae bacterium]|nr:hypothetical protein [Phycisphaerae bacterium]